MNKFRFLLCILLLFNISNEIDVEKEIIEAIYDKVILIFKGMSDSNKMECYTNFAFEKREPILDLISKIIIEYQENPSQTFSEIISKYYLTIFFTLGGEFLQNCLDLFINLYANFYDDEKRIDLIEQFGNNIYINKDLFFDASSNFVKVRGIDEKIVLIGIIIRAITNITLI